MPAMGVLPFALEVYQVDLWKKRRGPLGELLSLQRDNERKNLPERNIHRGEK